MSDRFQGGRRRDFGNSSECYKMCHDRPVMMTFGTQADTDMLSLKITKAEVYGRYHDGRRCYLVKSSACYKMCNDRPISMKFGTLTKTDMLSLIITKAKVYGRFSRWQPPSFCKFK
jgi:hypothetical protein